jgi:DDE_Tnp_1-associated
VIGYFVKKKKKEMQGFPILERMKRRAFLVDDKNHNLRGELCMDYTTILLPSDANMVPEAVIMTSLYDTLQQLSDARRGQGKRYELALILCLLVLAKMAGQTSLSAATDWIRHRAAVLANHFGLRAIRACHAR